MSGAIQTMAKHTGRPPKAGWRTPSGRLSRAKEAPFVPLATIRAMVAAGKAHGRWNTWLGRQTLSGRYTEMQYQAAVRYAALAADFRSAIGCPPLTAQAQDVGRALGRSGGEEDAEHTRNVIARWQAAQAVLSPLEKHVLDRVVVQQLENEGEAYAQALSLGLDRLMWLWEGRRSERR